MFRCVRRRQDPPNTENKDILEGHKPMHNAIVAQQNLAMWPIKKTKYFMQTIIIL